MSDKIPLEIVREIEQALAVIGKPYGATVHVETQEDGEYLWATIKVAHYGAEPEDMKAMFDKAVPILQSSIPPRVGRETWALAVSLRGHPIADACG